jgi:hypothetical protein
MSISSFGVSVRKSILAAAAEDPERGGEKEILICMNQQNSRAAF